ncbi:MAG: hypothetical protein ACFE9Q_13795 [Candidatus Hodarchaeota archaeon]
MNENQPKEKSNQKEKDIFIKKEAFRNMLTHVLRFGNNALEKSIEVLGVCIGKYDSSTDKLIMENAIPLIHGDKVEIGFDKDIYELLTQIGKKYSTELIGYYHSHPSWGLYLSESDLKNIQYFQNENFPNGFCIVFDHTLMGKDGGLGFEAFRLDAYMKPDEYHIVPFEVEIPNSLEYFKWIQKFSEDFQKRNPILIKEINEFVEPIPSDLQEIPISEDTQTIEGELDKILDLTSLDSGFQDGTEKLSEMLIAITKNQMGEWIKDIDQGTSKGSEYINKAVNKMNEAISLGLIKVDNWFNKTLNDTANEFKKSVFNYVNSRVLRNKELTKSVSDTKNELLSNLKNLIGDNFLEIKTKLENLIYLLKGKVENSFQVNSEFEEKMENLKSYITNMDDRLNYLSQGIEKKIKNSIAPFQSKIDEKIEKLNTEMIPLKEFNSQVKDLLEKLQKTITEFRNLTQK